MAAPQFVDPTASSNGTTAPPPFLDVLNPGEAFSPTLTMTTERSPEIGMFLTMRAPLVYLGGPIGGLSYGDATDWRVHAQRRFHRKGIIALSPMRWKQHLAQERVLVEGYSHPLSSQRGLTARDRFDCKRCDLFFVNLLLADVTCKVSTGTMIELGWADDGVRPIVGVMDSLKLHDHPMVREVMPFLFTPDAERLAEGLDAEYRRVLDEAIDVACQILLP
jgi:hypothetical protein